MLINEIKNKNFISSTLAIVFFMASYFIFQPFLAPYLVGKGFLEAQISVIFSAAPFTLIILSSVLGKLSDELGRKRIIILSLFSVIIAIFLFLYFAYNVVILVAATILLAVGVEGYSLTVLQKFEDGIKKDRGLLTGIFQSLSCLGYFAGPIIGTWVVVYLPIEFTFKIALIIIIALFIFHYFEKEKRGGGVDGHEFNFAKNIKEFWASKDLRGMGILGVATHATSPAQAVFIPLFIIESLGGSLADVGIFASIFGLFHLLQFFSGRLCDRNGSKTIILWSVFFYGLFFVFIYFVNSIVILFMLGALISLAGSFWNTSAWCYMSKIGEKIKKEGMVTGSYVSIAKIGAAWSYLLSGIIAALFGVKVLFIIYGSIVIAAVFLSRDYLIDRAVENGLE